MRKLLRSTAVAVAALALSAPAGAQLVECRSGHKQQQVAELIFGRTIGGRIAVSEARWMQFVDGEITPRFPDGLTVLEAAGQWRHPSNGKIIREASKVVQIVLPGNAEDLARLDEVVAAYKRLFKQQSVGVILRPACVSF